MNKEEFRRELEEAIEETDWSMEGPKYAVQLSDGSIRYTTHEFAKGHDESNPYIMVTPEQGPVTFVEAVEELKAALRDLRDVYLWVLGVTYSPSLRAIDGHGYSSLGKFWRRIK